MTRRSLLFTPGDRPKMMRSAPDAGADVLVFDLEDAVSPADKPDARIGVRDVLADPDFDPDAEVVVRLNPIGIAAAADLEVLGAGDGRPDAVMLPKVADADDVRSAAELLAEHDFPQRCIVLLESAAGVLHAETIAAAEATSAVALGAEDLVADIGASRTPGGEEVLYARERVVMAAAAAGIDAIDTVFTDIGDEEGLEQDTNFAIQLGYDGKLAIHPAQVGVINRAFTPDEDQVEWARRVLQAREETDAGVFTVDGEMIDAPLLAQAERIVSRAEAANSS